MAHGKEQAAAGPDPTGEGAGTRASERGLVSLLDHLPGMAYRCANAPGWPMEVVSEGALALTGYAQEEFVSGRVRFSDLIHPADRDGVWERVQEAVERRRRFRLEYRIRRRDGEERHVWDQGEGVFDADGRLVALEGFVADDSERRERELALARSEERLTSSEFHYRQLFFSNPFPAWTFDPGTLRITDVNRAAVERYGYTREEFLEMTVRDLPEGGAEPVVLNRAEHPAGEGRFASHGRARHRTRSGETLEVEVYSQEVSVRDRRTRVVLVQDMTERLRSEEALRASEQRFRALIESSLDIISVISPAGEVRYQSPSMETLLGYDPEAMVGESIFPYVHPDDAAHVAAALSRVLAEPERTHSVELRFRHADGSWRHMQSNARSRLEVPGVNGVVVHSRDVTERVRVEEELRFQRAILSAQSELSPDGILAVTQDDQILSYDAQFLRMWNLPERLLKEGRREAVLAHILAAVADPEDFRQRVAHLNAHPEAHVHDFIALADGRTFERFSAPFSIDGEVLGRIWFHRDVTELISVQESLRAAKEEAERANRAKSEFLSRMSHELRTPMNAVLGFAQVLEMDVANEEDRESVQQILRAGRHLLELIDEVLDLSRIEAERIDLSLEPVRLADAVAQCLELMRPLAAEGEVTIHRGECDGYVEADLQRLKQVLLNLLANAIKYNRRGGRVEIECRHEADGRLSVAVRDTGPGLGVEQLEKIFVPFERLGAEASGVQGTGLGLAVSKGLTEVMGGSLTVESAPGEGSTFRVTLAAADPPDGADAPTDEAAAPAHVAAPRFRVLYIEDNLSNLELVERVLARRSDIRLIPTMQGRLGLQLAREQPPDLILLDVHLPDIRGDEVLHALKAEPHLREVPVIVVSADATRRQMERLLAAGADEYLTKPLDLPRFLAAVETALTRGTR